MQFIDANQDRWVSPGADDAGSAPATITPAPYSLLDLAQWQTVRSTWPADLPVGVALPDDVAIIDIAADLPRLALVVLHFPKWTDGRAYSQAHLLRARHRFAGQVRATGEVLVDMLPLLHRCGVDAVRLRPDQSHDAARRALNFFPAGHYQGDVVQTQPRFARVVA